MLGDYQKDLVSVVQQSAAASMSMARYLEEEGEKWAEYSLEQSMGKYGHLRGRIENK